MVLSIGLKEEKLIINTYDDGRKKDERAYFNTAYWYAKDEYYNITATFIL